MEQILQIAKDISPLGVIALLVIAIILLIKNSGSIGKLNWVGSQNPSVSKSDLDVLNRKLDTIASNHLHELPDMKKALDRIEAEQVMQGNRLTGVETTIKILLKV